jgi:hypothetical protein
MATSCHAGRRPANRRFADPRHRRGRGAFACVLGGLAGRTLFITAAAWQAMTTCDFPA